mgnify:CR=1 FL=1
MQEKLLVIRVNQKYSEYRMENARKVTGNQSKSEIL